MELILHGLEEGKREKEIYDALIVGSGPAGLQAGIYLKRSGLSVLILEKEVAGGLVKENPLVENYLGFKSIIGEDLAKKFLEHAKGYVEIRELEPVIDARKEDEYFVLKTEKAEYRGRAVIIATGTTHRMLGVKGEKELYGRGVSYCVTCDGYLFKGKKVAVIGGGNSGAIAAITLKDIASEVFIIEFMPRVMCDKAYEDKIKALNIPYYTMKETIEIVGDEKVEAIKVKDRETGEIETFPVDGVFIYVGLIPQNEIAKKLNVKLDEKGYVITDVNQRTSVRRVYAAGDIVGRQAQIVVAAGQGAVAALSLYEDLKIK